MSQPRTGSVDDAVRLERVLPAAPGAVYAAWTDPTLLRRWMSPLGHAEVAVDVRVGGTLQIVMVDDGFRIEHRGTYLEVDPPRRLRFTWVSSFTDMAESVVTVELLPEGEGTRLVLVHEHLPERAVDPHAGGWGTMLDRLGDVLSEPSPRQVMA